MLNIIIGIFTILHGLVHLLYFGQSWRLFELQPGMAWPDDSWSFGMLLGDGGARMLASIFLVVAAIGFVVGGIGIFARQAWWRPAVVGSAALSAVIYFLFWNGKLQRLDNQGAIGILIDLVILAAVLIFKQPGFEL
jgi:hypothetical protein